MVVGLAANGTPWDWLVSGAGLPAAYVQARRHGGKSGPPGMPILDTAMTWGEVRRAARACLPGSRYRRHLLWRYSLVWDKPRGVPLRFAAPRTYPAVPPRVVSPLRLAAGVVCRVRCRPSRLRPPVQPLP
ncbi:hypothetical protein HEK616_41850 [Streptomyces nigrescens]|uniref:Transposase n=1 Tax=Streptomyces nigrescens TaxID=1920 RepID=A0ABM7ZWG0_STRNI|nr:hypothetical protein [Streptomyces nigrescens]BDM70698.1 hypothetical protein HEK616_41850 [Streptomyces nigrescens]